MEFTGYLPIQNLYVLVSFHFSCRIEKAYAGSRKENILIIQANLEVSKAERVIFQVKV